MRIWIRIHIHNTDFKRPLEDVLSADFPLGDMFAVVFLYEVPWPSFNQVACNAPASYRPVVDVIPSDLFGGGVVHPH